MRRRVFARSVIPASSLVGRLRRLRKFNDSFTGEMLFRDASMRRHRFQIAAIAGNDSQLPHALQQSGTFGGDVAALN